MVLLQFTLVLLAQKFSHTPKDAVLQDVYHRVLQIFTTKLIQNWQNPSSKDTVLALREQCCIGEYPLIETIEVCTSSSGVCVMCITYCHCVLVQVAYW